MHRPDFQASSCTRSRWLLHEIVNGLPPAPLPIATAGLISKPLASTSGGAGAAAIGAFGLAASRSAKAIEAVGSVDAGAGLLWRAMAALNSSILGSSIDTELQFAACGSAGDCAGGYTELAVTGVVGTRDGSIIDLCVAIPKPAPRTWRPKLAAGPNGFILDLNEIPAPACATGFHSPPMSFAPSVPRMKSG